MKTQKFVLPPAPADLPVDSVLNVTVSVFADYYKPAVLCDWNLYALLVSDQFRPVAEKIRKIENKKARDKIKATVPCFTVSGSFFVRNDEKIKQHTNLLCLDFDKLSDEKLNELWQLLARQPFIAYIGYSVSGKGIFAVVPIESGKNLKQHFFALEKYFFDLGFRLDNSCKNLSRLRGASYTAVPYINHRASIYTDVLADTAVPPEKKDGTTGSTGTTDQPVIYEPTTASNLTSAVKIALERTQKKYAFVDGQRNGFTVSLAGFLNRLGIDQNAAFYELCTVVPIDQYKDHKKAFFDTYRRYQSEYGTAAGTGTSYTNTSTTGSTTGSTKTSTGTTDQQTPAPAQQPAKRRKSVFLPLKVNPFMTFSYSKYIGQSPEFESICNKILTDPHKLWQILAPTRSGKTYAFTLLFIHILKKLYSDKIIVFVNPLRNTTDQTTDQTPDHFANEILIFENGIFTYDKSLNFLSTHKDRLKDVILVVDEIHDTIKSAGYRTKTIATLCTYFDQCFKVIGLSGTPFGIMENLGFRTVTAVSTEKKKYNTTVFVCDKNQIQTHLLAQLQKMDGKDNLIFCPTAQDTSKVSAAGLSLAAGQLNLSSDYIYSGNKLNSAAGQHIRQYKKLPAGTKNVFSTSTNESGMTLECDNIFYINASRKVDFCGIWQSLSRNTTDKVQNIYIYTTQYQPDGQMFDFDTSELNDQLNQLQTLADSCTMTKQILQRYEILKDYQPALTTFTSAVKGAIIWNDCLQKYIASPYVLLSEQYDKITASYSSSDLISFLEQYTSSSVTVINLTSKAPDQQIENISQQIVTAAKDRQKTDSEHLTNILGTSDTKQFLSVLADHTENANLKLQTVAFAGQLLGVTDTEKTAFFETLYKRSRQLCETATGRYMHLCRQYLGAIDTDNLQQWCVLDRQMYSQQLKQLEFVSMNYLLSEYTEEKLIFGFKDDKMLLKICQIKDKNNLLADLTKLATGQPHLTVTQSLQAAHKYDLNLNAKNLCHFLRSFADVTPYKFNTVNCYKIKSLDWQQLLDKDRFLTEIAKK